MQITRYSREDVDNVLAKLNPTEIDKLPCGAIQLDKEGKILFYNLAEGEITGRAPKTVIGKNFFREVAPCTQTPEFQGEFLKVVATGTHVAQFQYTFDYKMMPTRVTVHMKKALTGDSYWIVVNRM